MGYVQNNSGFDEQKAFIWDEQHGMRLLNEVLENDFGLDLSDWQLTEAWSSWMATVISEDGTTIVGVAVKAEGQQEAWRAVIPEPATAVLLALAGLCLLARACGRRKRTA